MRKFTESLSNSLFDDKEQLESLLVELNDIGIKYELTYTLNKKVLDHEYKYIVQSPKSFEDAYERANISKSSNTIECYSIKLELDNSGKRNVIEHNTFTDVFMAVNDRYFEVMEILNDIRIKTNGLGCKFLLVFTQYKFNISILNDKA